MQYAMWDTDDSDLAYSEDYHPKAPGVYTWPIKGETGYYKAFHAVPLPPVECEDSKPRDTEYVGCYADSSSRPVFSKDKKVLKKGRDGMTNEVMGSKRVANTKGAVVCLEMQEMKRALKTAVAAAEQLPFVGGSR